MEVQLQLFLTSHYVEVVIFTARPLYLRGKRRWYSVIRGLSGPPAGLDVVERRISSLYWDSNPKPSNR